MYVHMCSYYEFLYNWNRYHQEYVLLVVFCAIHKRKKRLIYGFFTHVTGTYKHGYKVFWRSRGLMVEDAYLCGISKNIVK